MAINDHTSQPRRPSMTSKASRSLLFIVILLLASAPSIGAPPAASSAANTPAETRSANLQFTKGNEALSPQERDLDAQESMAKSARWTLVLAWIQAAVSAATIGLLWFSFRESRRATAEAAASAQSAANAVLEARDANKIAAETSERQLRPYVFIDLIDTFPEEDPRRVQFSWRNFGHTPAKRFAQNIFSNLIPPANVTPDRIVGIARPGTESQTVAPQRTVVGYTADLSDKQFDDVVMGRLQWFAVCDCSYEGASGEKYHTREVFQLMFDVMNDDGKGARVSFFKRRVAPLNSDT